MQPAIDLRPLQDVKNKKFYCVAYEKFEPALRAWVPGLMYTHGRNQANANFNFMAQFKLHEARLIRVVAIGPVVGYYEQDVNGKIITTV